MSKCCAICEKRVKAGNQISHSHRKTKRTWAPNLQRVRALVNGQVTPLTVCTRCLRSGKVERYVR